MPGPFEKPDAQFDPDKITERLERGTRARQILQLGVGQDLDARRDKVLRLAEEELRGSLLTPERALMHIACCNALRRYRDELNSDIEDAQRAANQLHAESEKEPADGE